MSKLASFHRVHLIGIGGIGVSYLAQWFLAQGAKVSGSNLSEEPILELLRKRGVRVKVGPHKAKSVPKNTNLVIYTLAAPKDNPERVRARRRGIPEMSHAEAVGELTKEKFTIAVCGTHGKSTTTAMAGLLLTKAGFNPTVFVGTRLKEFGGSNCRVGKSQYLVLEADEWAGAFWHYYPNIIIWTTADADHLDFYKTFRGVLAGFQKFIKNLKKGGLIIANADDKNIGKAISALGVKPRFYSLKNPLSKKIASRMQIPGNHNVSNALAVTKLAEALKIPQKTALGAVGNYRGAWRRFEYKGTLNGAPVYDDYGHHPTEIKATLQGAREKYPDKRIWLVYQPHQFQRTKYLFREFAGAFDGADYLVLLDIYNVAGRERRKIRQKISSQKLADSIRKRSSSIVLYKSSMNAAAKLLTAALGSEDVCIIMGAGNIWQIFQYLKLN